MYTCKTLVSVIFSLALDRPLNYSHFFLVFPKTTLPGNDRKMQAVNLALADKDSSKRVQHDFLLA